MDKQRRKFALSASLVWTTPVIQSVVLPAHAQTSLSNIDENASSSNQVVASGNAVITRTIEGTKTESDIVLLDDQLEAVLSILRFDNSNERVLRSVDLIFQSAFERTVNITNSGDTNIRVRASASSTSQFDLTGVGFYDGNDFAQSTGPLICAGTSRKIRIGTFINVETSISDSLEFFIGSDLFDVGFTGDVEYQFTDSNNNPLEQDVSIETIEERNRACVITRYRYTMQQQIEPDNGSGNNGGLGLGSANTINTAGFECVSSANVVTICAGNNVTSNNATSTTDEN